MIKPKEDITGFIFDIKKYAIHDGPGIRTTVFFKGCPLRCAWCHNPESWSMEPELLFSPARCIQCGDCIESCPNGAIRMDTEQGPQTDPALCSVIGQCVKICPPQARKIVGRRVNADEVMAEILKDAVFYDASDGGVTFSGGEPLLQPAFLKALLSRCRQKGFHTAVDSSLHAKQSAIEDIIPLTNLFLCDLKHMDSGKHKQFTGVGNEAILDNFRFLAQAGGDMVVRVPVVPGFNDTVEAIKNITAFVESLQAVQKIELLPYNSGGVSKGRRLITQKDILKCSVPDVATMNKLNDIVKSYGMHMKAGG